MTVDSVVYCWCSEIISRSTLKVVWGQRDTRRDGALGMTLQKLSSLPFSLHCLWPCVPSSLVCGVNTLLSNALLSRLGVTVANCLVIGDFYVVAWGKKLFFLPFFFNSSTYCMSRWHQFPSLWSLCPDLSSFTPFVKRPPLLRSLFWLYLRCIVYSALSQFSHPYHHHLTC